MCGLIPPKRKKLLLYEVSHLPVAVPYSHVPVVLYVFDLIVVVIESDLADSSNSYANYEIFQVYSLSWQKLLLR